MSQNPLSSPTKGHDVIYARPPAINFSLVVVVVVVAVVVASSDKGKKTFARLQS